MSLASRTSRRIFPRYKVMLDVEYNDFGNSISDGGLYFQASNLSAGGIFICSEFLLEIGTEFGITLRLPGHPGPTTTQARVTWVSHGNIGQPSAGMGLQFLDLSAAERLYVDNLLQAGNHLGQT